MKYMIFTSICVHDSMSFKYWYIGIQNYFRRVFFSEKDRLRPEKKTMWWLSIESFAEMKLNSWIGTGCNFVQAYERAWRTKLLVLAGKNVIHLHRIRKNKGKNYFYPWFIQICDVHSFKLSNKLIEKILKRTLGLNSNPGFFRPFCLLE